MMSMYRARVTKVPALPHWFQTGSDKVWTRSNQIQNRSDQIQTRSRSPEVFFEAHLQPYKHNGNITEAYRTHYSCHEPRTIVRIRPEHLPKDLDAIRRGQHAARSGLPLLVDSPLRAGQDSSRNFCDHRAQCRF